MKDLHFIFRMLKRNPLLVFVNLPGLAIGLSAVILLSVYLKHELSFDQHFKTKDHVVRLYNSVTENGNTENYGICLRKAYTEIPQQVPEIKSATQIFRGWDVFAEYKKVRFPGLNLLYADREFFDVFGVNLPVGNHYEALAGTNKVVLNESTARKIFNRTDCVGQIINVSETPFTVTGVIKDLPNTTHFNFDLLASLETLKPEQWGGLELFTYFRINDNADIHSVGMKIAEANNKIMRPWAEPFNATVKSGVEKLTSLHLHTLVNSDLSAKGSMTSITIVATIAFFILLIALVNFVNLYILHGEQRIAEIAARKSLGATKAVLSKQFFTETGIIGFMAFMLAAFILVGVHPYFAQIMQSQISYSDLFSMSGILVVLAILGILIFVAGAYPSYYLSKLDLVNALKGKSLKVKRKSAFSRVAVILQFSISVFLITAFSIVLAQINYLKNMPLGFNPENVIGITNFDQQIDQHASSIENELKQLPFVKSIGSSTHTMGSGCSGQGIKIYGSENNILGINEYRINPGFDETMQLELKDGRYFSNSESDKNSVILNEAGVKMLGGNVKLGSQVDMHGKPLTVIGIVKDFFYVDHPGEPIAPLVLTNYWHNVRNIYIRTLGKLSDEQRAQIEKIFKNYSPEFIYSQFELKDVYANKFDGEERVMKLVSAGAVMAIVISFIGLLALSILNVNRRKKEIGIRKVIGSSEAEAIWILLSETFVLIGIAISIAFVASYFVMHQWLEGFIARIALSPIYFVVSAAFALMIAFFAVGWQTWKAATRNPVEALRYE
jgi:putative ABC transport system permease protein